MTSQIPVTMESLVVGKSARMKAVFEYLRVIGNSESTVLITGESGTGKEVTATLIHQNSRRRHHPFVAVSCALFTETLIESELFGHERGSFTGAIKDRPGRFEMAEGGTIFLDDIDDVPMPMQVKLLRVLQNRTIERLGGTRQIPIDVRVITEAEALGASGVAIHDHLGRLDGPMRGEHRLQGGVGDAVRQITYIQLASHEGLLQKNHALYSPTAGPCQRVKYGYDLGREKDSWRITERQSRPECFEKS